MWLCVLSACKSNTTVYHNGVMTFHSYTTEQYQVTPDWTTTICLTGSITGESTDRKLHKDCTYCKRLKGRAHPPPSNRGRLAATGTIRACSQGDRLNLWQYVVFFLLFFFFFLFFHVPKSIRKSVTEKCPHPFLVTWTEVLFMLVSWCSDPSFMMTG